MNMPKTIRLPNQMVITLDQPESSYRPWLNEAIGEADEDSALVADKAGAGLQMPAMTRLKL